MLAEETIKDMYRAKCPSNIDSYIEANGKGYTNFKITAKFVAEYLVNNDGWTPNQKANHKTKGETLLYKMGGDSIILKENGIHITFDDGHWRWFAFSAFMNHLKKYRLLKLKLDSVFGFYNKNKDEW